MKGIWKLEKPSKRILYSKFLAKSKTSIRNGKNLWLLRLSKDVNDLGLISILFFVLFVQFITKKFLFKVM